MHPMFVTLFIGTDTDDLLTEEQDRKRRATRPGGADHSTGGEVSGVPLPTDDGTAVREFERLI
jgi:hypothetical protein